MAKDIQAYGKWIVFDYNQQDQQHLGVLTAGKHHYPASSPRKYLDQLGRERLLPAVLSAVQEDRDVDVTFSWQGKSYRILVDRILSPKNDITIGAMGTIVGGDEEPSPKPLVGALEWWVDAETREVTAWWDEGLYALYGLAPNRGLSPTGDMAKWMDGFVHGYDRLWFRRIIDKAIRLRNGERHLVSYEIELAGLRKRLELSAWMSAQPLQAGGAWARGIVRQVPKPSLLITPGIDDVGREDLFYHLKDVLTDRIMVVIDTASWEVFHTVGSWRELRFVAPPHARILEIVHPDDQDNFIKHAVEERQSAGHSQVELRIQQIDDAWADVTINLTDAGEDGSGRYVLCVINPVVRP